MVLHPSFPEAELDRQKKLLLAGIERERSQPNGMATRVLPRLVYGDGHPYASPMSGSGTTASVSALTRADVERWYQVPLPPLRRGPGRRGRHHHEGDPAPPRAALRRMGAREGARQGPRAGWQARRAAPLRRRSARIGPVGHPGGPGRAAAGQPGRDRTGSRESGPGRRLHRPHQHEPARGQALVVRRPAAVLPDARGPRLFFVFTRRPGGQDQGIGPGDPEGAGRDRRGRDRSPPTSSPPRRDRSRWRCPAAGRRTAR